MSHFIAGFSKSDHFTLRQWDRCINDKLLTQILKNVETNHANTLFIVSRKVLKKINGSLNKELFIKVDNNTLITCFYCEFQEYDSATRDQNYLIINKI